MDDKKTNEIQDPTPAMAAVKHRRGFSLLDLMLLASAFAISFSILRNTSEVSGAINLKDPVWNGVFQGMMAVFISLSLFAAIQLLRDWWNKEGRFQPGHLMIWIELVAMSSMVVRASILALAGSTEFYSHGTDGSGLFVANIWSGVQIASQFITVGLALYGSVIRAANWGWWWRVTFIVVALLNVSGIVRCDSHAFRRLQQAIATPSDQSSHLFPDGFAGGNFRDHRCDD